MLRDLRLELLTPDDEAALAELFTANDVEAVTRWFDPFPLTTETAHTLAHHRGRDLYWGVWERRRLVGFAMVRGWDGGHPDRVYGCFVDREEQGRGIATAAAALMLEELRERGVAQVRARVHDDNEPSLRHLRANGFTELARSAGRVLMVADLDSRR